MIALITCVVLIGLMLLGVPVCAAMGGTAAAMFASLGYGNILAVMAQRIYNGTTSFTMLAIPFFILAGNLMNTGGITDRIFGFCRSLLGHFPGGLAYVNILSSFIFSGMSGSALADVALAGVLAVTMPGATLERVNAAVETAGAHAAGRMSATVEYLLDIATIAPLVGLLGTVLGMFKAFSGVANDIASAKPVVLAQGVSQAIITTVFGLAVSIPVLVAYAFFRRRVARRTDELEDAAAQVVDAMVSKGR